MSDRATTYLNYEGAKRMQKLTTPAKGLLNPLTEYMFMENSALVTKLKQINKQNMRLERLATAIRRQFRIQHDELNYMNNAYDILATYGAFLEEVALSTTPHTSTSLRQLFLNSRGITPTQEMDLASDEDFLDPDTMHAIFHINELDNN